MSWNDRVVWSEGQFLLPQMFQQQERYLEHVMHYRSLPLTPFFWGFSHYNIDGEALNIGKLILKEASGIFPDGTPFNAPDHTPLPPPLTILPEHLNQQICLAVPPAAPRRAPAGTGAGIPAVAGDADQPADQRRLSE